MAKNPNFRHAPDAFRLCPKCKLLWSAEPRTYGQHTARCTGFPKPGTGTWYALQSRRRKWGLPDLQAGAPRNDIALHTAHAQPAAPAAEPQEFGAMDRAVAHLLVPTPPAGDTAGNETAQVITATCGRLLDIIQGLLQKLPKKYTV